MPDLNVSIEAAVNIVGSARGIGVKVESQVKEKYSAAIKLIDVDKLYSPNLREFDQRYELCKLR